jgi:hypothetical protein
MPVKNITCIVKNQFHNRSIQQMIVISDDGDLERISFHVRTVMLFNLSKRHGLRDGSRSMTTGEQFPRDRERVRCLGNALPLIAIGLFPYLVGFCEEFKPLFNFLALSAYRRWLWLIRSCFGTGVQNMNIPLIFSCRAVNRVETVLPAGILAWFVCNKS